MGGPGAGSRQVPSRWSAGGDQVEVRLEATQCHEVGGTEVFLDAGEVVGVVVLGAEDDLVAGVHVDGSPQLFGELAGELCCQNQPTPIDRDKGQGVGQGRRQVRNQGASSM